MKNKDRNIKHAVKMIGGLFMLVLVLGSTTGCIAQRISRALVTEGTYAEMESSFPDIPSGCGRLFVYLVDGASWGDYAHSYCSIDRDVYPIVGGAFWWQDLPVGTHKLTADNICSPCGTGKMKYGLHALEFHLGEGEVTYCRIDMGGIGKYRFFRNEGAFGNDGITWTPVMVEPSVAIKEIRKLDLAKYHQSHAKIEE